MSLRDAPTVTADVGYAKDGSIYALGLINGSRAGSSSEKRGEDWEFLRGHLQASQTNEVISHEADLRVGLTASGSTNLGIVNDLKEMQYTN